MADGVRDVARREANVLCNRAADASWSSWASPRVQYFVILSVHIGPVGVINLRGLGAPPCLALLRRALQAGAGLRRRDLLRRDVL